MLPKLFIGSSQEAKDAIGIVVQALSNCATCVPWYNAPEFNGGGSFSTLSALSSATDLYDFAVFILSGDDKLNSREKRFVSPRDNVVFEMGLFLGNLGADRVLGIVRNSSKTMKIPSDLAGINMPRFSFSPETPHENIASITQALTGFSGAIRNHGLRDIDRNLADGWGFDWSTRSIEVKLAAHSLHSARPIIGQHRVAIAARIENNAHDIDDDPDVRYSPTKPLPDPISDMIFNIPESDLANNVSAGQKVQMRVLLVPPSFSLDSAPRLRAAKESGCRIVEPLSAIVREDS